MIRLEKFSEGDFNKSKSRDLLPLECNVCSEIFLVSKNYIQKSRSGHNNKYYFCSLKCRSLNQITSVNINCKQCFKYIIKLRGEFNKTENSSIACKDGI